MMIPLAGKGIAIYDFVNGTSTAAATATIATATAFTTSAATRPGTSSVAILLFVVAATFGAGIA
jgi:hypothetical protein